LHVRSATLLYSGQRQLWGWPLSNGRLAAAEPPSFSPTLRRSMARDRLAVGVVADLPRSNTNRSLKPVHPASHNKRPSMIVYLHQGTAQRTAAARTTKRCPHASAAKRQHSEIRRVRRSGSRQRKGLQRNAIQRGHETFECGTTRRLAPPAKTRIMLYFVYRRLGFVRCCQFSLSPGAEQYLRDGAGE